MKPIRFITHQQVQHISAVPPLVQLQAITTEADRKATPIANQDSKVKGREETQDLKKKKAQAFLASWESAKKDRKPLTKKGAKALDLATGLKAKKVILAMVREEKEEKEVKEEMREKEVKKEEIHSLATVHAQATAAHQTQEEMAMTQEDRDFLTEILTQGHKAEVLIATDLAALEIAALTKESLLEITRNSKPKKIVAARRQSAAQLFF